MTAYTTQKAGVRMSVLGCFCCRQPNLHEEREINSGRVVIPSVVERESALSGDGKGRSETNMALFFQEDETSSAASEKREKKKKEELASLKIQTAFRAYLARRALRALKGVVRLQAVVRGNLVRKQTISILHSMQTIARVQSHVQSRRVTNGDDQSAKPYFLKKQQLPGNAARQMWDDSIKPIQEIKARLESKQGASLKRQRALTYTISNQPHKPGLTKGGEQNKRWGWSWMSTQPWDSYHNTYGEKSPTLSRRGTGNITAQNYPNQSSNHKISTPLKERIAKPTSVKSSPLNLHVYKPHVTGSSSVYCFRTSDDDKESNCTLYSTRHPSMSCRYSVASSQDDLIPNYMTPTVSSRAKLRSQCMAKQHQGRDHLLSARRKLSFSSIGHENSRSGGAQTSPSLMRFLEI